MTQDGAQDKQEFFIEKIYIKDLSYESNDSAALLFKTNGQWAPEINLKLNVTNTPLPTSDSYEVVLHVHLQAMMEKKSIFIIELQHAGIFLLRNFAQDAREYMLNSFCANIIFPYAREIVSDLIVRAGFPVLYLAPVNFDAFYEEVIKHNNSKDNKEK
jgi:preprotein translocase subunit SecB